MPRRIVLLVSAWLSLVSAGCAPTVLSVDDAVLLGAKQATFVAYVERVWLRYMRDGMEHVPVSFFVEGQEVAKGETGEEGRISCVGKATREASRFEAKATVDGRLLRAEGAVYQWQDSRVIIAVDIDETIADTEYGDLLFKKKDTETHPIKGARDTLASLAQDFHILYLTNRPRSLLKKTAQWLTRYEFPSGPILTAPRVRDLIHRGKYKRRVLADLQKHTPNLLIGIGNTRIDTKAYGARGMLTLILKREEEDRFQPNAIVFDDWASLARFFADHREILKDPGRLKDEIDKERTLLEPPVPYGPKPD